MRKPRLHYAGGLYHVIARGNQRQKVFLAKADYLKYLKLVNDYLEQHGIGLYAYCLMPNHVHLLVEQVGHQPLSRYMQRLQSTYTSYFNRKHKKVGHLFQGRYKAILVDKDAYLLELIRYIHLNPFRAKLEERVGAYPWTGHAQYVGGAKEAPMSLELDKVLPLFGRTVPKARKAYERFVLEGRGEGHREDLYDLRAGHMLGDEEFESHVHEKVLKKKIEPSLKVKSSLEVIWERLKTREGQEGEPVGWKRSRWMAEAAYLAVEGSVRTQKEVADFFGVEATTVNKAIKRLKREWEKEPRRKQSFLRWGREL